MKENSERLNGSLKPKNDIEFILIALCSGNQPFYLKKKKHQKHLPCKICF